MIIILAAILGAFFNRVRGGLFDPDNKYPNIVWRLPNALVFAILVGFLLQDWRVIPAATIGMFVGSLFGWQMLNSIERHIEVRKNLIKAAGRGLVWTGCIALSVFYFNPNVLYFFPVGILFGLPYYLLAFIDKGEAREWGEYAWGAILWGGLTLCL